MAQSLISLITLATIVAAAPLEKRQAVSTTAVLNCVETYWSVAGDTCETISSKTQMPIEAITGANPFLTCDDIWVNTPICIPGPPIITTITFAPSTTIYVPNCAYTYYSVAGDTCDSIGAANGQSGSAIYDANTFLNCADIWAGTPICVPPASSTIAPPSFTTNIPPFTPTVTTLTGPVTTYIDASTTIVGLGPITTEIDVPPFQSCYTYTSQAGDTCDSIAAAFGLTADEIYAANTFLDCQNIWASTPICIPVPQPTATITGTFYPVPSCSFTYNSVQGDTCDTLAVRFHVSADEILAYNSFLSCDNIWANTPICVPPMDPITTDPITTVPVPTCSVTYTSVDGDTCDVIGSKFGLSGDAVYEANTFLSCNDIWPWTPVCIPFPTVTDYFSKRS